MKIKMRTLLAGPFGNANPGDVIDLPDANGAALVAGGYADAVVEAVNVSAPAPVERAVVAPAETAVASAQRRKRAGK
jgi:hypothetical protein